MQGKRTPRGQEVSRQPLSRYRLEQGRYGEEDRYTVVDTWRGDYCVAGGGGPAVERKAITGPSCPNCGEDRTDHRPGCALGVALRVLRDRDGLKHELTDDVIASIDVHAFWDAMQAPLDNLTQQLADIHGDDSEDLRDQLGESADCEQTARRDDLSGGDQSTRDAEISPAARAFLAGLVDDTGDIDPSFIFVDPALRSEVQRLFPRHQFDAAAERENDDTWHIVATVEEGRDAS